MAVRRAQERAETIEPAREHAAAVGHRLGFGPGSGIFVRDVGSPTRTLQGLLFLGLFLLPCLFADFLAVTSAVPNWVELVVIAVAVAGLVPLVQGVRQPGRRAWVYLYQDGIALVDHRGQVRGSARWAEIDEADWQWDPHAESSGYRLVGYHLRPGTAPVITLSAKFRDAHDPQRPGLAEALDEAVVRRLARQVLDRVAAGESVSFGPATLDRAGLTYGRKPPLPWTDIAGWTVDDGELRIDRAHGRRFTLPLDRIPGGWILVHVLTERARPG